MSLSAQQRPSWIIFPSQYDDAGIEELLRSGANTVRSLLQASLVYSPC